MNYEHFMPRSTQFRNSRSFCLGLALLASSPVWASNENYEVFITNERSGEITVIDGASAVVTATFPAGKRPRGIQVSPDHKTVFVAVSGTPISPPPQLLREIRSSRKTTTMRMRRKPINRLMALRWLTWWAESFFAKFKSVPIPNK